MPTAQDRETSALKRSTSDLAPPYNISGTLKARVLGMIFCRSGDGSDPGDRTAAGAMVCDAGIVKGRRELSRAALSLAILRAVAACGSGAPKNRQRRAKKQDESAARLTMKNATSGGACRCHCALIWGRAEMYG